MALFNHLFRAVEMTNSLIGFGSMLLLIALLGVIFRYIGYGNSATLFRRESIILVAFIWIITILIAALPFTTGRLFTNYVDSLFETTSAITTTGATIITPKAYSKDKEVEHKVSFRGHNYSFKGNIERKKLENETLEGIEAIESPFLLWRSLLQWIGGMGIVVLFLTIMPPLGIQGKLLYQAEVAGPIKVGFTPRIKDTAFVLWKIYLSFTVLEILLLLLTNSKIDLFDAICLACSTISTGGFTIHSSSVLWYESSTTEWILILFMLLGSLNFALYIHIFKLKIYKIYNPDFLLFISIVFLSAITITSYNYGNMPIMDKFRTSLFQVVSFQTSSGFYTANYGIWNSLSKCILIILAYVGGMAGSTCGGIKTTRIYLTTKVLKNNLRQLFRPQTVQHIMLANTKVDQTSVITLFSFLILVFGFSILATFLFLASNVDTVTSIGLVTGMINNTGVGLGMASPAGIGLSFLSPFLKFVGIMLMLLGRLEFITLLFLFLPSFWQGR